MTTLCIAQAQVTAQTGRPSDWQRHYWVASPTASQSRGLSLAVPTVHNLSVSDLYAILEKGGSYSTSRRGPEKEKQIFVVFQICPCIKMIFNSLN